MGEKNSKRINRKNWSGPLPPKERTYYVNGSLTVRFVVGLNNTEIQQGLLNDEELSFGE